MSGEQTPVQVRFCPNGGPTFDRGLTFTHRVPTVGEEIDGYVIVEVRWMQSGKDRYIPWLIAHQHGRPRAEAARR